MRTLDEFRDRHPRGPRPDPMPTLRILAHEQVRVDAMTGDPNWDHFLAYLEAAITASKSHRDHELLRLRDPLMVREEDMRTCKALLAGFEARIAALEEVLALPKYLKEQSAEARERIAQMTRDAAKVPRGA